MGGSSSRERLMCYCRLRCRAFMAVRSRKAMESMELDGDPSLPLIWIIVSNRHVPGTIYEFSLCMYIYVPGLIGRWCFSFRCPPIGIPWRTSNFVALCASSSFGSRTSSFIGLCMFFSIGSRTFSFIAPATSNSFGSSKPSSIGSHSSSSVAPRTFRSFGSRFYGSIALCMFIPLVHLRRVVLVHVGRVVLVHVRRVVLVHVRRFVLVHVRRVVLVHARPVSTTSNSIGSSKSTSIGWCTPSFSAPLTSSSIHVHTHTHTHPYINQWNWRCVNQRSWTGGGRA